MFTKVVTGILTNAPIWVWPLLIVLIVMGLAATRTRNTLLILHYFMPLLGIIGLGSVRALGFPELVWPTFLGFTLIGAALGFYWQSKWNLDRQRFKVRVQGEWLTLIVLMLIYFSNFADGTVEAVQPALKLTLHYNLVFASIMGLCSGSFTGRSLSVILFKPQN